MLPTSFDSFITCPINSRCGYAEFHVKIGKFRVIIGDFMKNALFESSRFWSNMNLSFAPVTKLAPTERILIWTQDGSNEIISNFTLANSCCMSGTRVSSVSKSFLKVHINLSREIPNRTLWAGP